MSEEFVLPPIVGDCTDGAITILCEAKRSSEYVIQITDAATSEVVNPITIHSNGLTFFSINVDDDIRREYIFQWFRDDVMVYKHMVKYRPCPKRLIFFSCDLMEAQPDNPLWEQMFDWDPDIIVHCGDNIYGDEAYSRSMRWLRKNESRTEDDIRRRAQYYYAKRYRKTWSRWAKIIGSFPNVFGIDDHEITNNIQQRIMTMDDDEKLVKEVAMQSFDIYQGSLTKNVLIYDDGRCWVKYWEIFDGRVVSMAFFDRPQGGREMTRSSLFDEIPEQTEYLIAVTGAPAGSESQEEITHASTTEFLDRLYQWKTAVPNRKCILVSGDAHFSAVGVISLETEEEIVRGEKKETKKVMRSPRPDKSKSPRPSKSPRSPKSKPVKPKTPRSPKSPRSAKSPKKSKKKYQTDEDIQIGLPTSTSGNVGKLNSQPSLVGRFTRRLTNKGSVGRGTTSKKPFDGEGPVTPEVLSEGDSTEKPGFNRYNTYQRELFDNVAQRSGTMTKEERRLQFPNRRSTTLTSSQSLPSGPPPPRPTCPPPPRPTVVKTEMEVDIEVKLEDNAEDLSSFGKPPSYPAPPPPERKKRKKSKKTKEIAEPEPDQLKTVDDTSVVDRTQSSESVFAAEHEKMSPGEDDDTPGLSVILDENSLASPRSRFTPLRENRVTPSVGENRVTPNENSVLGEVIDEIKVLPQETVNTVGQIAEAVVEDDFDGEVVDEIIDVVGDAVSQVKEDVQEMIDDPMQIVEEIFDQLGDGKDTEIPVDNTTVDVNAVEGEIGEGFHVNIESVAANSIPFVIASPVSSQPWRSQWSHGLALRKYQVESQIATPDGKKQLFNYKVDRLLFRRNYVTMEITENGFRIDVVTNRNVLPTIPQAIGMAKFTWCSNY